MYLALAMNGEKDQKLKRLADPMLVAVTLFWGVSFTAIKDVLNSVEVSNLLFIRFALAALVLLPLAVVKRGKFRAEVILPGLVCGAFLAMAFLTQAVGLQYTTASRSGFITGLNVVLVPLFSILLFKQMPGRGALVGAGLAFLGLYFLTSADQNSGVPFNQGDVWTLACAFFVAGHVLTVGRFAPQQDHFWLTFIQFLAIAGAGAVWAGAGGEIDLALSWTALGEIAFLAVFCTVCAFWTQTWAQQYTTPTRTALIFTMEPVFATFFAWLLLDEILGLWGWVGAVLILAGILLAELRPKSWSVRH